MENAPCLFTLDLPTLFTFKYALQHIYNNLHFKFYKHFTNISCQLDKNSNVNQCELSLSLGCQLSFPRTFEREAGKFELSVKLLHVRIFHAGKR